MRLIYAVVVQSAAMVSSSPYSAEMVSGAESNHQHEDFQSSAIPPLFENVRSWPEADTVTRLLRLRIVKEAATRTLY